MSAIPPSTTRPTVDQAVAWLSQHRYDKYLSLAAGDHDSAMKIYLWNSALSSAILRDLAHLEVAIRNAFDTELSKDHPDWAIQRDPKWLRFESGTPRARRNQVSLNDNSRVLLSKAQRDLGSGTTHGKVVARLSFGFWHYLTVKARESTVWTRYLHKAFPKGTARAEVHALLESAVSLRNRLAHMEPVSSSSANIAGKLTDINRLFSLVAPDVHDWIWAESDVMDLIGKEPVPGLISLRPATKP
jgi:hypothetical protein